MKCGFRLAMAFEVLACAAPVDRTPDNVSKGLLLRRMASIWLDTLKEKGTKLASSMQGDSRETERFTFTFWTPSSVPKKFHSVCKHPSAVANKG